MKDLTKVEEQFHYFNITSGVDSVFGNWAVSNDGDVVNCLYPYAIMGIHLDEQNWVEKIQAKVWFKDECTDNLIMAIKRAGSIKNS